MRVLYILRTRIWNWGPENDYFFCLIYTCWTLLDGSSPPNFGGYSGKVKESWQSYINKKPVCVCVCDAGTSLWHLTLHLQIFVQGKKEFAVKYIVLVQQILLSCNHRKPTLKSSQGQVDGPSNKLFKFSVTPQRCWPASGISCFAFKKFFKANLWQLRYLIRWCNSSLVGGIFEVSGNFSLHHFSYRTSLTSGFFKNP